MAMLEPELAVLDETDSGPRHRRPAHRGRRRPGGARRAACARRAARHPLHADPRLLRPDVVHVLVDGRIVERGGPELADASRPRATSRGGGDRDELRREPDARRPPSATCATRCDFSKSRRTSRCSTARCTATGSSTSTRRRRRSARSACSTPWTHYYETTHANVHRGVYTIAEEADRLYDAARVAVGRFIGAPTPSTR